MAENSRKEPESVAAPCLVAANEGAKVFDENGSYLCCGGYREHKYRCPARVWPATATPEIRRLAVRGDCIAPAHAQIEDLVHGLDYQQRKQLTEVLALIWDDGFEYGQQVQAGDQTAACEASITFGPPGIMLAEDLTPFLDWPLYFPDDSVHCYKPDHGCDDRISPSFIASKRRMTPREFLADIKEHAEEAS
jgi:hypothetical protein